MGGRYSKRLAGILCLALLICGIGRCPIPAAAGTNKGANTLVVESVTFLFPQELEEKDIVNLKDAMTYVMGDDFIVGTAIDGGDLADEQVMQLVTKHFNGVTLGNALKPQFILTYVYGDKYPQEQLQTTTLNGKSLSVPKLDYSFSEKSLDYIYDWNQKHPNDIIKMRGHVLIWHAQTPEWFFHVDYDANKPYVDKETMSLREEWYIKSVAEHFTGASSKYKDMFYGWDVVNEAISDWPGGYRKSSEEGEGTPSSWWAVFKSNKFITDAFVFANKYFPASVELYYNDYGDCAPKKSQDILTLLKDVKNTAGARIDGFGMQAHYSVKDKTSGEDFKKAVRAYCEVVDHVQITELDFVASDSYDGTSKTQSAEDERIAACYKEIYDAVKSLKAEGKRVTGLTVWGVIDKNSWLNGTTGKTQCPLLFDNNYHAKKAFYALAEGGKTPEAADDTAAIEPKFSTVTLKKGESIFFELADGVDTESIKKITYKSNKAVVSVNKKGKITAKKKGSATVTATVKLKNGDTKKIKMKIKVVV